MFKKILLPFLVSVFILILITPVTAENSAEQYAQSLGIEKSAISIISKLDKDNNFNKLEKDFITWLASQDKESQFKLAFKYVFDGKITDEEIAELNLDSSESSSTSSVSGNVEWAEFMPGYCVQDIELDGEYLWLGTDEGLIKLSKSGKQPPIVFTKEDSLIGNDVQAVKIYDNELWIGTADGGLSKFDGVNFINYGSDEGLFDCRVMALDVNQDYVWLGLTTGLSKFTKETGKFKNFELPGGYTPEAGMGSSDSVAKEGMRRIFADSILIDGKYIWYGAHNLSKSTQDIRKSDRFAGCGEGLPGSRVTSLDKNKKYIFVSTLGGISVIDKENVEVKIYTDTNGLRNENVYDLVVDNDYLWMATEKGTNKLNITTSQFNYHYFPYDFRGDCILSLAVDQKYLWIGTIFGLYRLKKF